MYMELKETNTECVKSWYILHHPSPIMIDDIFSRRKTVSLTDDEEERPLPLFEYFIPFCDIQFRPSMSSTDAAYDRNGKYDPRLDGGAFRSDLHSFVFVYGDETLIDSILSRSWNRGLKTPLWAVRNKQGQPVRVSIEQMNLFRNAIRQMDFTICEGVPATSDLREGDKVQVINGPMEGGEGVITEIRERQGSLSLTIAFNMFDDKMQIAVPGISIGDVLLLNDEANRLLTDTVISNFETNLIELLSHRHGENGSADLSDADRRQLQFLNHYSGIAFDSDVSKTQFTALMLICAYLMNDTALIEQRTSQVVQLLDGATEPVTDLQCYLMTALFIVNHDPALRARIKAYRQSHPDCPLSIRRFQSIAKKIKCKKIFNSYMS